jgi:hypothetical protein
VRVSSIEEEVLYENDSHGLYHRVWLRVARFAAARVWRCFVDILAASVGGELMTIESPLLADSRPGH